MGEGPGLGCLSLSFPCAELGAINRVTRIAKQTVDVISRMMRFIGGALYPVVRLVVTGS